jgi:hypothetical protein
MRSGLGRILQQFELNANLKALKGYRSNINHLERVNFAKDVKFRGGKAGSASQAP